MKKIGIIGIPTAWSTERLASKVEEHTGHRCVIDMSRVRLDLDTGKAWFGDLDLSTLDAVIIRKIGVNYTPEFLERLEILRFLEERGLPFFSRPQAISGVLDRLTCTVTMSLAGVPMPSTVVTESVDEAVATVERFERAVVKPMFSTKARGMMIVEPGNDLREQLLEFKSDSHPVMYIQQVVDLPGQDLGVAFMGGEYLGTYARVSSGHSWNTTTRSGGKYQSYEPSAEIIEMARRAQEPFGLDFTCVDVAECEKGPVIFEVSAFGGFRGLIEGPGIDPAELYTGYVLERLKDA